MVLCCLARTKSIRSSNERHKSWEFRVRSELKARYHGHYLEIGEGGGRATGWLRSDTHKVWAEEIRHECAKLRATVCQRVSWAK